MTPARVKMKKMHETGNDRFQANQVLPGVYHIADPMNVFCTLLVGEKQALLFDTGYGLFNLQAFVRTLTTLPLTVLLSHGHHDHACGAVWFEKALISKADREVCRYYTRPEQRLRILDQAENKGLLPEDFDRKAYALAGCGNLIAWEGEELDLGGMTARILPTPGHTPGSLGILLMPHRLLLAGDNWNPTTWLFFAECEKMNRYVQTMQGLLDLPFEHVLAPHHPTLLPGQRLRRYVQGLNDATFSNAVPSLVAPYEKIRTYACHPEPGTTFVFDRDKL